MNQHNNRNRTAFTVLELMVTIGIIIVLLALAMVAILRFRDTGPYMATQATLTKIKASLSTQWRAVSDKARNDPIPSGYSNPANPNTRLIFIKDRLNQAFPTSFTEANAGGWNSYKTYLSTFSSGTSVNLELEQAVCLLMILERGPSNPGITADQLGTSGAQKFPQFSPPVFGCADAWGNPLIIQRNTTSEPFSLTIISKGADGKLGTEDDIKVSTAN